MKQLLGILTLGALLASASGDLLADDRRHGGKDRWDNEYRDHRGQHKGKHARKHYKKHHAHPHWKRYYRDRSHYHHRDRRWYGDQGYLGAVIGLPGLSIAVRHYHDGRACYDRHDRRHRH